MRMVSDFPAFFMGHKSNIEAKYTTNKGILAKSMLNEMRMAFKRSEELLDLETKNEDPLIKQREQVQLALQDATHEELGKMLEVLKSMSTGQINSQANGL